MKKLIVLLLFVPGFASAQSSHALDSVKLLLKTAKADTARVKMLNDVAGRLAQNKADEVFKYAHEAINLSQKLDFKKGLGKGYYYLADAFINTNRIDSAEIYLQKSIDVLATLKNTRDLASSYNYMGWLLNRKGKQIDAIAYFKKAADIFEKTNDLLGSANSLGLLAGNYGELHEYSKALASHQKAYTLRIKAKDTVAAAKTLAGIGILYRYMQADEPGNKKVKLAVQYLERARKIFIKNKEEFFIGLVDKEVGITYSQQTKYSTALHYLVNAETRFKQIGAERELGPLYNAIGRCYLELNQLADAKVYIEKALVAAKAEKHQEFIADAYNALYIYYKLKGNNKLALFNHEKWIAEKDSIDIHTNFNKLADLTRKYETEKKEQQINILNKENTIQKLSIAKQKTTIGIVAGSSVVLLGFGGLLYNRNKNKQKIQLQEQQLTQRAELTHAVIEAEEKERTRIASDLHDGVGQLFSAVKMNLNGLFERVDMPRDEDRFLAEKTLALVEESCKEVRYISHQMMPNMLLRTGIASDVKSFIEKIDSEKLKVNVEATGFKDRLESNVETVLYRVIQEAVNNVIKHANASLLDIKLTRESLGIRAVITDNGIGFNTAEADGFSGIGLKNIAARVEYLKGTVNYQSAKGAGTTINVWVPVG